MTTTVWGVIGFAGRLVIVTMAALQALLWMQRAPPASTTWSLSGRHGHAPFGECCLVSETCLTYEVKEVLTRTHSDLQTGAVLDTEFFGRVMLLDNEVMITERDEAHYHEMLAHVPLAYLPKASRVLIIGGGDGGTLKQVLQHKNIEKVTMVEIDSMVVQLSKDFFPTLGPAYSDPRVDLKFMDGGKFVADRAAAIQRGEPEAFPDCGPYDAILLDTTDFGIAVTLFQSSFYADLKHLLRPAEEGRRGGILAFNVDSPSWALHVLQLVSEQLTAMYQHVAFFQTWQPTYGSGHYSFVMASDSVHAFNSPVDWEALAAKQLDLVYYNKNVHVGAFLAPTFMQQGLPASVHVNVDQFVATEARRQASRAERHAAEPAPETRAPARGRAAAGAAPPASTTNGAPTASSTSRGGSHDTVVQEQNGDPQTGGASDDSEL